MEAKLATELNQGLGEGDDPLENGLRKQSTGEIAKGGSGRYESKKEGGEKVTAVSLKTYLQLGGKGRNMIWS